jgi:hypothetical protein
LKELIEIINEIVKYGLNSDIEIKDKEKDLENSLVKLYSKYFSINYEFDNKKYTDFNKEKTYPNIIENVKNNFKDFGWYHSILNLEDILEEPKKGTGDAIDDLSDIIYDLLEIKWKNENNSENDAWWFFEFIFHAHTQQHLINLLNYLKNKK